MCVVYMLLGTPTRTVCCFECARMSSYLDMGASLGGDRARLIQPSDGCMWFFDLGMIPSHLSSKCMLRLSLVHIFQAVIYRKNSAE